MDRSIIEGDPHSLVEGMLLCGYSIGAKEGYVYCRAEYPLAIHRLKIAIAQAEEYGLLGDSILGTDYNFKLHVKEGAGAFVCGEETALLASIEGRRGEPRPRPPFPAIAGLWGKPTNLNNVKSYAYTSRIIANGAPWFSSIGTKRSPGTAVFALTGKVNNTGLLEVPMGITVGEIVFDVGDGVPNGKKFKAVQTGGPLGGCIPVQHLNVPVDFDSLKEIGAVMGSGGMIVVDEDTCMVEFSKFFLTFATAESCGKCIPCRVGGRRMLEVLTHITDGKGTMKDIDTIKEIAAGMTNGSLCALGQLTPGPVMSRPSLFRGRVRHSHSGSKVPGRLLPGTGGGALHERLPGRRRRADLHLPDGAGSLCRGAGSAPDPQPVRPGLRPRLPGLLRAALPPWRHRRARGDPLNQALHGGRGSEASVAADRLRPEKGQNVAIVGSGPAGLTAALRLRQMGYGVSIFEALPVAGGMMAVGIPDYRLPRETLNEEIQNVLRAGAELKLNTALGRDFTIDDLMNRDGYKAVVLALGAHISRKLGIAGEDAQGVYHGVYFLRDVALGKAPDLTGKRVVVVGGGNVAIDAARTAIRLGAVEVNIVYRRARAEMPAYAEEIHAAEAEGCILHFLTNPIEAMVEGDRIVAVKCQNQSLGDFDRSGRRRPVPVEGSEFNIACDLLVPAIGQQTDLTWLNGDGIATNRDSTFIVNRALSTTRPGVFAAGDNTLGPATVIEAVAQGNNVAVAVDVYLQTGELVNPVWEPKYEFADQLFNIDDYADAKRPVMPELEVAERVKTMEEVDLGLSEHATREECKRCLRCDLEWLRKMDGQVKPIADMFLVELPKVPEPAADR